jgi:hypothetical protein
MFMKESKKLYPRSVAGGKKKVTPYGVGDMENNAGKKKLFLPE